MFNFKTKGLPSCILTLIVCMLLPVKSVFAQKDPSIWVVFDASSSMKSSQAVIADMLKQIERNLEHNSNLVDNAKLVSFRDIVIDEEAGTLSQVRSRLTETKLISSSEDVLSALQLIASTPELNEAIVLIFSDGKNTLLENSDTAELMQQLRNRRSEFHAFIPFPAWCDNSLAFAVDRNNMTLGQDSSMQKCDTLRFLKGKRFGKKPEESKLSSLAFETGGLVWPIYNFDLTGLAHERAPKNFVDKAATKLAEIIEDKGGKSLFANVKYDNATYVGKTVFFEVTSSESAEGFGDVTSWEWDYNGDGEVDDVGTFVQTSFSQVGENYVSLILSNSDTPAVSRTIRLPIQIGE
ncbi:hypothetical protein ISG33_02665 [Glaciecola sp. MH2013]|uniref:hypothetical protein n=1 Tax=Glaciecola sp. MH2013 TaxID=2785524 RepID=UPI00189DED79|nr:hypothetical protein [Glaciecola sp. MH2013]MBF7072305.1 hypothetical protein [Glaciecola sp. MH2013]